MGIKTRPDSKPETRRKNRLTGSHAKRVLAFQEHQNKYKLVHEDTGEPIEIGTKMKTFRGETVVVTGWRAPLGSHSTGRVFVKWPGKQMSGEFFPAVIHAKLVLKEK